MKNNEIEAIETLVEEFQETILNELDKLKEDNTPFSVKKSQVHFWVITEQYKALKRIGVSKEMSIGEMFNDMLTKYLIDNKDY
jgi:hypothetical protein